MRFFITYGRGGLNFVAYIWNGRLYLDWSLIFGFVAYIWICAYAFFYHIQGWWLELCRLYLDWSRMFGFVAYTWICRLYVPGRIMD